MSKEINISNYEEYAMDYIDGTLSEELMASFDAFLILHPEIAIEIDSIREIEKLESTSIASFDKNSLKIPFSEKLSEDNYDDLLIASVEGQLNEEEEQEVSALIASNIIVQKDYHLYQKTKLSPDLDVVYPLKSSLKKPIPLWQNTSQLMYRAAAIAILALGSTTIWNVINEEKYIPRNGVEDFTSIELMLEQRSPSIQVVQDKPTVENSTKKTSVSENESVHRSSALAQISTLNPEISSIHSTVKERTAVAYQPKVSEWVGDEPEVYASANKAQELNLNQFIGKQFFGLEPEKTPTTLALMKEGLVKTISESDNVDLKTSEDDSNKKTIEFLAGNFGFKRVNYK